MSERYMCVGVTLFFVAAVAVAVCVLFLLLLFLFFVISTSDCGGLRVCVRACMLRVWCS
jgi:hypothetical protein